MTSLRVVLPFMLSVSVVLSSPSQSKRDTGSKRTEEEAQAKSTPRHESRGADRTPQGRYEPLPHDPPMTRPVDVNYPPVIFIPVASPPPHGVVIDGPGSPRDPAPPPPAPQPPRKITRAELDDCVDHSETAGYSFSQAQVVSCEDSAVDVYLSTTSPDSAYFLVPQDNDIRDLGEYSSLRAVVRFRPREWAEEHAALLSTGHVYVVWTYDGDFYLVRVLELGERHVAFEWVRHSRLSRATAAEAERKQKEEDAAEAKRRENLGPYFTK